MPGEQVARGLRRAGRIAVADERRERTEQQHVDERPQRDVEQAVRAAHEHVRVPARDRAHPQPSLPRCRAVGRTRSGSRRRSRVIALLCAPSASWRSARWRNTPSRSPRPYAAATSRGVPSATTRPCERNTTRSHTCSTSLMSWLVISSAAPVLARQVEQAVAHPQRDVGVERRGRLVEHEQARPVQRRPHDADQRALPGRQLGAHRVGEVRDPEAFEALVDLRGRIGEPVELAVELQVLAHAHALGERQVAGREPDVHPRPGCACARVGSRRSSTSPSSGDTTPRIMSSVVVLPAPFGPSSATRSPACTTRSTPSTARARR